MTPAYTAGREAFLFGRRFEPGKYALLSNQRDYFRGFRQERLDCRDLLKRAPLQLKESRK